MRRLLHILVLPVLALLFATGATAGTPPGKQAPTSTSPPVISGTAQTGSTLSANSGGWSGNGISFAFQWLKCDSAGNACGLLAGQTASSHLIASTEAGSTLRVVVSAQNKNGVGTATSAPSAAVTATVAPAPAPPPPPPPSSSPPPPSSPPPSAAGNRFGFSTGGAIQNMSASDLGRYLDGADAAHTGWIRFDINWSAIQTGGPTSYNWAPYDNVVTATTARGMKVLGMIGYTPSWARPGGTSDKTPPTNLADYANFAKAAVARYSAMGVHAYEVWNEPNIVNFWSPAPDPARYAQMLKLAYGAIKSADPSATVVSAGLSPYGAYGERDTTHVNPLTYLEAMYANGAGGSFDALGWHPYNYPWGLSYYAWSAWSQMSETTPNVRSIMTARGDSAKQVWVTEFGAPTGSTTRDLTEAAQAQLVTEFYGKLKDWSWAGPGFFYSYRDNGTNKSDVEQNFGLLHYDWSAKPSYAAYQTAAAAG
jgi:polysaccharide biosynthesis protein PslG